MYKCNECNNEFDNYKSIMTSYESYYGVNEDFLSNTPFNLKVCPFCNSEDIDLKKNNESEVESMNYEDLTLEEAYQLENAVCDGDSKTVIVEK